ncbi:murein biosynthesis integral membrane protein MurJ [Candidatus Gottesmanbacteria bacterium RBG_16_52_11]|uniref:Probable lipid II flippase MurJ n=1 Tax=Candidatus Gottesmanbacteria bacterium RBG_16_52_11 TaxID=1798374 RepID=A0A1F5YMI9_9BACT|nr:MAG: murein biosynthesis integral membrane protein MurJ [Candidatus Gottesmanbacteria bacterium RBG_16_52_11]
MMPKFLAFLYRKQHSLESATIVLMVMVVASGFLGLVRYWLLNKLFTPDETGLFIAAFRLPNLLFEILAMGAMTSAFIPVFTRYLTKGALRDGQKMASVLINYTVLILLAVSIPAFIFTESVSRVFAPGFSAQQIATMAGYTRTMIVLQVVPMIIGNYCTGMLQSGSMFIIPALAPVVYNIGTIGGILLFAQIMGPASAVVGVGIGAALFMFIQLPLVIRQGYRHRFTLDTKTGGVREVAALTVPRMVGIGVSQVDLTVDLVLSSLYGAKMVTAFFLAQSLQQLPVRLFGSTISQAVLPTLSQATAKQDHQKFRTSVMSAFHMALFFVQPVAVFFIILRIPIVRLVFGAPRFDWEATVATAMTLSAFSFSLFAQAISQVFTRGFFALYDSRTPVTVGIATIILNTSLSALFVLVFRLPVWSMGLSTSVASIINASLLIFILDRRIGGFGRRDLLIQPAKMMSAAAVSGIVAYIPMKIMDQLIFDTTRVFGLLMLTVITLVLGISVYLFLAWVLNIDQIKSFFRLFDRIRRFRASLTAPVSEIVTSEVVE